MTDLIQAVHANLQRTKATTHIVSFYDVSSFYLNGPKGVTAYFDNEKDADAALDQLVKTLLDQPDKRMMMWSPPAKSSIDEHDLQLQTLYETFVLQARWLKDELGYCREDTDEHRFLRYRLDKVETARDTIAKELVEFNPTMIREVT